MKRTTKIFIISTVFVMSLALMVFFIVSLILEAREIRQGQEFFAEMPVAVMPRVVYVPVPVEIIVPPVNGEEYIPEPEPELEQEPEPAVPFVDFDYLRQGFPSIVGWIQSEGTVINYPIVQGRDNDFYLRRLPDRSRHNWGSIFLDYRNAADFSDTNILIYGHNMQSGDKFGTLKYYRDQSFFEAHPSMFIFTPTNNYVLMIFAGYVLDATVEVPPMRFTSEAHFDTFINDITRRSVFQSDIRPSFGDTLVFLCTCTEGGSRDERLIITGILFEI